MKTLQLKYFVLYQILKKMNLHPESVLSSSSIAFLSAGEKSRTIQKLYP